MGNPLKRYVKVEVLVSASGKGKKCHESCPYLNRMIDELEGTRSKSCLLFDSPLSISGNNSDIMRCPECVQEAVIIDVNRLKTESKEKP